MTEETPTLAPEPTLLVAIGNPLRGDDGVAAEFARQVAAMFKQEAARGVAMRPPWRILEVHPLCPEHAASIACFGEVIFVDADPATLEPKLQQLCSSGGQALSHSLSPAAALLLAEALYGWKGHGWLLHLPARDFTPGAPLSGIAKGALAEAVALVWGIWGS